jgi:hypothetical protein
LLLLPLLLFQHHHRATGSLRGRRSAISIEWYY